MKQSRYFLILAVIVSLFTIAADSNEIKITNKYVERSMAEINDTLYAGKFEVSNRLYQQFLSELLADKKTEEYNIARIDTSGWEKGPLKTKAFATVYHSNPIYADFPVVNISYEGAVLFCQWLTDKYHVLPHRRFKEAILSLPDSTEWLMAASVEKGTYATGISLHNTKGQPMANFRQPLPIRKMNEGSNGLYLLAPVKSYWPNAKGMYNLSGNAAEMLSTKGFTKGGGFLDTELEMRLTSTGRYDSSSCQIGFRYFMHVH